MARTIDPRTKAILAAAEIDGVYVRITEQLAPAEYAKVKKILVALGGPWSRKQQAHVFAEDPAKALAEVLNVGTAPLHARAAEGYVETPPDVAAQVVRNHSEVEDLPEGSLVLEPSAGTGALVRAILNANPGVRVHAIEPNLTRAEQIQRVPGQVDVYATLEHYSLTALGHPSTRIAAVVMNPPFSLPGKPTVWIDHVRKAFDLVEPGGHVTAIVPAGVRFREDRKHRDFRALLAANGNWPIADLPEDAFKASGTGVRTCVIRLDKPNTPAPTGTEQLDLLAASGE